ncbi:PREDICTED: GLIPR1-like protein 1, partial [Galeopterus variegatus]|uniref:GLIPR1-like protein 1 n=1 Tax=Galeopterus variegatus TaxID=482537 RepID=A0ABM0S6Z4_GALVR
SWDEGLAKMAKAWANKCKFQHNSCLGQPYECYAAFEYVGENIWLGGIRIFTPNTAVTGWYNETEFYDFDTLSCSRVCGHYTQCTLEYPVPVPKPMGNAPHQIAYNPFSLGFALLGIFCHLYKKDIIKTDNKETVYG